MSLLKLLDKLSNEDVLNAKGSRKDTFNRMKNLGKGAALASIPFGLAATSNKTKAATMNMASAAFQASPTDVLNFALTLEYLERNFYQMALGTDGLIPEADRDVFGQISKHEDDHVDFLVGALGEDAIPEPTFDFTGGPGGLELDTFSNYATFMALAQGFEDTGVRAYKGQAGALIDSNDLLKYALQIHSIEARHASQVRRMRGEKGWIVNAENTLPAPFAGIYQGVDTDEDGTPTSEANLVQGGVDLSGMFNDFGGDAAVSAAFDEPLTMGEVNAIASTFIVVPQEED
ncbi:ferritin-like domain-containing protein [Zunongwangia endophytica]|uniref:Ferritin-like domain-containing protein n=1 Tax=Zunongwangia endophytica TaxID=1808945 RepID=A0ABV8H963_9FLAO|nr:ferritin-like domain-containing protein [Zunongwangia endophytica]MDN3594733.1 ferritin-like domain-containing protein [Zunongwangia endophytica]